MEPCTTLAGVVRAERTSRAVKPRVRFDPQPVSDRAVNALLAERGASTSAADVSFDDAAAALKRLKKREAEAQRAAVAAAAEAARQEAATPRQLPFSLPPRQDRPAEPVLMLTNASASSSTPSATAPFASQPADTVTTRKRRTPFRASDDAMLCGADPTRAVEAVSEFSGIGALEHGLHAGFEEAGWDFRLVEACDTDRTKEGRHASAVLRKRFPDCRVLNPEERTATPYPERARMVDVTAQCTEHSGLNTARRPWVTERDFLEPVLERLAVSPQIECVVLENVPNFAKCLDGQDRSSYSFWVEGLEECGFTEHAYVILPTKAAGDLHWRVRLLSLSTRGAFHPAAALMRLLDPGGEDGDGVSTGSAQAATPSAVFAFTTGSSETRFQAKGGVGPTFGALPAYNTGLNAALFVRGAYYKLSPWLASRCSGLPADYQQVWDFNVPHDKDPLKRPTTTCVATALGNMVSPLQARELGFAIASEWLDPRRLASVSILENAPALPLEYQSRVPYEFPTSRGEATLCFSSTSSGRWHRVAGRAFHRVGPAATLDELCDEALRRGELSQLQSTTDLNRCVDDTSLESHHRRCAAQQYERIQAQINEELRRESQMAHKKSKRPCASRSCVWAQCDTCLRWRRLSLPPASCAQLPERWVCSMNKPPFNRCDVDEEDMYVNEVAPGWNDLAAEQPFTAESDRWLVAMGQRADQGRPWTAIKHAQRHLCSVASASFTPMCFDYYFKSRTADELKERAEELAQSRAGALVCAGAPAPGEEQQDRQQEVPLAARVGEQGEDAARDGNSADSADDEDSSVIDGNSADEESSEEDVPAAIILGHHFYGGARPGSLYNVYVRIRYADGSVSGGSNGAMEPSEPLCASSEGPDVLYAYCNTESGKALAKYVPSHVLEAGSVMSDLERARGAGVMSAVRDAAFIRADATERAKAKRKKMADAPASDAGGS